MKLVVLSVLVAALAFASANEEYVSFNPLFIDPLSIGLLSFNLRSFVECINHNPQE